MSDGEQRPVLETALRVNWPTPGGTERRHQVCSTRVVVLPTREYLGGLCLPSPASQGQCHFLTE